MAKQKRNLPGPYMLKKCRSKYLVLQYLMLDYQFIHLSLTLEQVLVERFLIHPRILNMAYLKLSAFFQKRGETLDQAAADPNFYLEKVGRKFHLKKEHNCGYYAQVQGQLALTGLKWCDFCIYLSNSN